MNAKQALKQKFPISFDIEVLKVAAKHSYLL